MTALLTIRARNTSRAGGQYATELHLCFAVMARHPADLGRFVPPCIELRGRPSEDAHQASYTRSEPLVQPSSLAILFARRQPRKSPTRARTS